MPSRADEAIVLARYPFRERDLVVTLLTRVGGQVRVLARHVRGARGSRASALEPLATIRVSYFERRGSELATLDEAALVRSAFPLAAAPAAWAAGQVVAELALVFFPPGERLEAPYRLIDRCVGALLAGAPPLAVVAYAELWLMKLSGVLPELDRCGVCGAELPLGEARVRPGRGRVRLRRSPPARRGRAAVRRRVPSGSASRSAGRWRRSGTRPPTRHRG